MWKHPAMAEETGEPLRASRVLGMARKKKKRCRSLLSELENIPASLFDKPIKPQAEQINVSTPVPLTFEQFKLRDLPFHLPLTPGFAESSLDSCKLFQKTESEAAHFFVRTCLRLLQPRKQRLTLAVTDQLNELLPQC
jgi:hypothetical protein